MQALAYIKYKILRDYNSFAAGMLFKGIKGSERFANKRRKLTFCFFLLLGILVLLAFFIMSGVSLLEAHRVHTYKPVGAADSVLGSQCYPMRDSKLAKNLNKGIKNAQADKKHLPPSVEKFIKDMVADVNFQAVTCERVPRGVDSVVPDRYTRYLALKFLAFFVSVLLGIFIPVAMTAPDWDLEWLFTFPIGVRTLMWAEIAQRSVFNGMAFIMVFPYSVILFFSLKVFSLKWLLWGPCLIYFYVSAFLAGPQLLMTIGVRMIFRPSVLKNIYAVAGVLAALTSLPALLPDTAASAIHTIALHPLRVLMWTPPGLLARLLSTTSLVTTLSTLSILALELAIVAFVSVEALHFLLRDGATVNGLQDSLRSKHRPPLRDTVFNWYFLSPVMRKELALLLRDHLLLMKSLLLPLITVGVSVIVGRKWRSSSVAALSTAAFCVTIYSMFTLQCTLVLTEAKTLWIVSGLPMSLEKLLFRKMLLGLILTMTIPLIVFLSRFSLNEFLTERVLIYFLFVECGIFIFSFIATSFGYFSCDPFSGKDTVYQSTGYMLFFMLLAILFAVGIHFPGPWSKAGLLLLTGLAARAYWRRLCDSSPYFQDPAGAPPLPIAEPLVFTAALFVYAIGTGLYMLNLALR